MLHGLPWTSSSSSSNTSTISTRPIVLIWSIYRINASIYARTKLERCPCQDVILLIWSQGTIELRTISSKRVNASMIFVDRHSIYVRRRFSSSIKIFPSHLISVDHLFSGLWRNYPSFVYLYYGVYVDDATPLKRKRARANYTRFAPAYCGEMQWSIHQGQKTSVF